MYTENTTTVFANSDDVITQLTIVRCFDSDDNSYFYRPGLEYFKETEDDIECVTMIAAARSYCCVGAVLHAGRNLIMDNPLVGGFVRDVLILDNETGESIWVDLHDSLENIENAVKEEFGSDEPEEVEIEREKQKFKNAFKTNSLDH